MRVRKEQLPSHLPDLYTPAGFFMLRAPALPADALFQLIGRTNECDLASTIASDREESWRARFYQQLQALASRPEIEYALATASLSLLEGIRHMKSGEISKRAERAYSRLVRYLLRMCNRPTPFGLFAGIAIGNFAEETRLQLTVPALQQTRTRPDMNWLFKLIQQIEQTPEVVAQLHVVTNPTIHRAGNRAALPCADIYGQSDARTFSIRITPPIQFILENVSQPVLYTDLLAKLLARFSHATPAQIEKLLWQLWENHFLLSELRPPLAHTDPMSYVLEHLHALKGVETITAELLALCDDIQLLDRANQQRSMSLLRQIAQHQEHMMPDGDTQHLSLQTDAALYLNTSSLHKQIGIVAAQTAEVLLRLGRFARGFPHMQSYLQAFTERYGMDQEVLLLDLLHPETGLDAPPGYEHPPRSYALRIPQPENTNTAYDRILQTLAMQAVNERKMEIELTEDLLQCLERWSPKLEEAPPSLEIYLQLAAPSQEAIDQNRWQMVVAPNCGSPGAGRSFGRFFDLFPAEQCEALQQCIQREEALYPDVIFAELSYLPWRARSANVAVRAGVRRYEIAVGVTPSVPAERVILLSDLVVGVRANRFYLRSLRLGKEVIVCQSHMLNPASAPNVCRFLLECGINRFTSLTSFDWGTASSLPFLPRVVYKQAILCPARWHLTPETIKSLASASNEARWFADLQQWRATWRVPRYVYLTAMDNRLLLDLERPLLASELQAEIAKLPQDSSLVLEEVVPDFEHLWLEDTNGAKYFSEIVVPLLRTSESAQPERIAAHSPALVSRPQVSSSFARNFFPGDSWTYLKLYASYQRHDELIAGPMREIIRTLLQRGLIDQWFYLRYCDTAPHLRLRLHTAPAQSSAAVMEEILNWSRQLVEQTQVSSFSLDPYEREVERYGGPKAIEQIEQLFTADSVVASNLVTAQYNRRISLDPEAIAIFSLDRLFADWGLDLTERLSWLRRHTQEQKGGKEFYQKRQLLCDTLLPWEYTRNLDLLQQREDLCQLVAPRLPVLTMVSTHLRELEQTGDLWVPIEHILGSLAHMHINRLLGIHSQREQRLYTFWQETLASLYLRDEKKRRKRASSNEHQ